MENSFTVNFPCKPESFEVQVFDLEGTELFMSLNSVFEWDGNDKDSTACISGIYAWKIKYMYHMTYSERKGQLLLLR